MGKLRQTPHISNDFHPYILRIPGLIAALLLLVLLNLPFWQSSGDRTGVLAYATSISTSGLHSATNQARNQHGLSGYQLNSKLSSAAAAKAKDMFAKNYWAHNAPDGTTPWSFITKAGYSYATAGENLAKDFSASANVVNAWLSSSSHRANVLNKTYRDVGYAAVNGTLQGKQTTLVVAMYASPAAAPSTAKKTNVTNQKPQSSNTPQKATITEKNKPAQESKKAPEEPKPADQPEASASDIMPYSTEAPAQYSGNEQSYNLLTSPARIYNVLRWDQKASLAVLAYLALLFLLKHTLVWRRQKRGYRNIWLRAHPLAQAALLIGGVIIVLGSSAGVVL